MSLRRSPWSARAASSRTARSGSSPSTPSRRCCAWLGLGLGLGVGVGLGLGLGLGVGVRRAVGVGLGLGVGVRGRVNARVRVTLMRSRYASIASAHSVSCLTPPLRISTTRGAGESALIARCRGDTRRYRET